jgi:predicted small metal-binding protein
MGACDFMTIGYGKTAREAFADAVEHARYEHGHGGYTGTIAEKNQFIELAVPRGQDGFVFVQGLMDDDDPRINDKWGPAGCVALGDGKYLFFGWASS